MGNIFLSHSSLDKPFVRRLAADLINAGLSVWFDEWELSIGDSLIDEVYSGIEGSSCFILVVSRRSIESGWVQKELRASLVREASDSRCIILPIKLDECDPPLAVADRIYADFSQGYQMPFEQLLNAIQKKRAGAAVIPIEHARLPLCYTGFHLDTLKFESRLTEMHRLYGRPFKMDVNNIMIINDPEYDQLRARMVHRHDNIKRDPYYSVESEQWIRKAYNQVRTVERWHHEGLHAIINGLADFDFAVTDACDWYSRLCLHQLLATLYAAQNPDHEIITLGRDCIANPLLANTTIEKFYGIGESARPGIARTIAYDVQDQSGRHFRVRMPSDEPIASLALEDGVWGMHPLLQNIHLASLGVYIVPQMVMKHYLSHGRQAIAWGFDECTIGVA
jgi:hypothetical protein